eukprot:TRINITY_DN817_c0_g1_i8.p1 TRINITY_DN817_c0_g1~~TRINITY_DN817_c0_g1_i8.p1  ORF type:complete len:1378 (+),score=461.66 TRINITY_DN817_c0_g1_i8:62-4195(+)
MDRSVSPSRLTERSPVRGVMGLSELTNRSNSIVNDTSRMLMELEETAANNRLAHERATRLSPRAGASVTPSSILRTASPRVPISVMPSSAVLASADAREEATLLKKELAKQTDRVRECEKQRLMSEADLTTKLNTKSKLLEKLNEDLHALVGKDASKEEVLLRMEIEMRQLRDSLATSTERIVSLEAELARKDATLRSADSDTHTSKLTLTKAQQELDRMVKVKEKLDEMLSINQRSLADLQQQLAEKDITISNLETALREVDGRSADIMRALEDKARADAVRMEEMGKKNAHLMGVVESLKRDLSDLANEKSCIGNDFSNQLEKMTYNDKTLNERLITAQKTIDCVEAQLAAVKAEQLTSSQDAAIRQQELEAEIERLNDLLSEQAAYNAPGGGSSDDSAKVRALEDRLDQMILDESSNQERFHTLQAEIEKLKGDSNKYRDAHKRVISQLEQERVTHRKSLDEASQKVREAERRSQEAEDAVHTLKAEKQRMQDEVNSLSADLKLSQSQREIERKRLDDALASAQERITSAKNAQAEAERKADALQSQVDAMGQQLAEAQEALSRAKSSTERLRQQLDQQNGRHNEEMSQLHDKLQDTKSQLEETESQRIRIELLHSRLTSDNEALKAELAKKDEARLKALETLERERDEVRGRIESALRESKETMEHLQQEIDNLTKQLADAKRQLRDANETIQERKAEKDRLTAAYEAEKEQTRASNAEKQAELKRQLQRAESKVQTLELQGQRLASQIKDLEEELERERQRYKQAQDQLDEERLSHRKLQSDRINDLRNQIQQLQDTLADKDNELSEALRKIDVLQLDLERCEKQVRTRAAELEASEQQHKRDRDNFQRQLEESEGNIQRLTAELSDLRQQLDVSNDEIERSKQQYKQLQSDADQADADKNRRIQQLRDKLNSADDLTTQLQLQILSLKGQIDDANDQVTEANKQSQLKDAEVARMEEKLKRYQNAGEQLAALQEQNENLEDLLKKLRRDLESALAETEDYKRRAENFKSRREEDEQALDSLRRQNSILNEKRKVDRDEFEDELRKKNAELFSLKEKLTEALAENNLKQQLDDSLNKVDEWKKHANELTAQNETLLSQIQEMQSTKASPEEIQQKDDEIKELLSKLNAAMEQRQSDALRITELEQKLQLLETENQALGDKSKELEQQSNELRFLIGTRAQLVEQIMKLRESIQNTRTELMKITRERTYKKLASGVAAATAKSDKAVVDLTQSTLRKIDLSKKMVGEIVGKYFTSYEKLQHGSSSGHYNVAHDPQSEMFGTTDVKEVYLEPGGDNSTQPSPKSVPLTAATAMGGSLKNLEGIGIVVKEEAGTGTSTPTGSPRAPIRDPTKKPLTKKSSQSKIVTRTSTVRGGK